MTSPNYVGCKSPSGDMVLTLNHRTAALVVAALGAYHGPDRYDNNLVQALHQDMEKEL